MRGEHANLHASELSFLDGDVTALIIVQLHLLWGGEVRSINPDDLSVFLLVDAVRIDRRVYARSFSRIYPDSA